MKFKVKATRFWYIFLTSSSEFAFLMDSMARMFPCKINQLPMGASRIWLFRTMFCAELYHLSARFSFAVILSEGAIQ